MQALKRVVLVGVILAACAAGPTAAAAAPGDGVARALTRGEIDRAQHALYRALAIFRPAQVEERFGRVGRAGARDATMILRELARRTDELSGAEQRLAERILARPTDRRDPIKRYRAKARYRCERNMCFWWVNRTSDAPPLRDRRPRNGVPDQVDVTRKTFRHVWDTEVRSFGYRAPLGDMASRNFGVNKKLDIYIADIGSLGIYGYCATDDRRRNTRQAVSAYCVVDDDYSTRQFAGGATGRRALQVTAAHEFFHAVQFGIDWLEDLFLMEGTATWIEDEVYPTINDNFQYLPTSPISANLFWLSLDHDEPDFSRPESGFKYGAWIFWRYLSERFGRDVVRDAWKWAGYTTSLGGLGTTFAERQQMLADVFHQFGVANYFFASSYAEGALYASVPGVGPQPTETIGVDSSGVAGTIPMPHLTSDYYVFTPVGATPTSTLNISLTLPAAEANSRASFVVLRPGGHDTPVQITPAATTTAPFDTSVAGVLLVLTNPSVRFTACGSDVTPPFFGCFGIPVDDDAAFGVSAVLVP